MKYAIEALEWSIEHDKRTRENLREAIEFNDLSGKPLRVHLEGLRNVQRKMLDKRREILALRELNK